MIWYILGLFVAFWLGFFVCALMVIAKESDESVIEIPRDQFELKDGILSVTLKNPFDLEVSGDDYTYYDTEADMDADPLKQRLEQQRDERLDRERDK